ncbi:hypothetical protein EJ110_NYTH45171 [Nymphaea thermarum]|nr:hypothetical protein EJ110_NYTH45171 [Nymphaea thermarum]
MGRRADGSVAALEGRGEDGLQMGKRADESVAALEGREEDGLQMGRRADGSVGGQSGAWIVRARKTRVAVDWRKGWRRGLRGRKGCRRGVPSTAEVRKVNDVEVENLKHLCGLVENCTDKRIRFDCPGTLTRFLLPSGWPRQGNAIGVGDSFVKVKMATKAIAAKQVIESRSSGRRRLMAIVDGEACGARARKKASTGYDEIVGVLM